MNAIQRIACKAAAGACATERGPGNASGDSDHLFGQGVLEDVIQALSRTFRQIQGLSRTIVCFQGLSSP